MSMRCFRCFCECRDKFLFDVHASRQKSEDANRPTCDLHSIANTTTTATAATYLTPQSSREQCKLSSPSEQCADSKAGKIDRSPRFRRRRCLQSCQLVSCKRPSSVSHLLFNRIKAQPRAPLVPIQFPNGSTFKSCHLCLC